MSSRIPFRFRVFLVHLGGSFGLLSVVLVALYLGWYRWPGWYLVGAETVVGVLVLVDLGLGPLGSLVISSPAKPRLEWRRDMALIVLVQLVGLAIGVHTLWSGRPLFYTLSLDRIEVVPASAFTDDALESARRQGATLLPAWSSLPRWIWAPLPADPVERDRVVAGAIMGGADVTALPEYFRPWDEARQELRRLVMPLERLAELKGFQAEYAQRVTRLGRSPATIGALPVQGPRRDGAWLFTLDDGTPLEFWPVEVWPLVKQ